MSSDNDDRPFTPLQWLQDIHKEISKALKNRDRPRLLLIIIFLLFLGFGPGLGFVIKTITENPPTWYWLIFWSVELLLFLVSFIPQTVRKPSTQTTTNPKDNTAFKNLRLFIGLFLVTSLSIFSWNFIFNQSSSQEITFSCDVREDCFSWGEDILIEETPAFQGEGNWQTQCRENWNFKWQGVIDYSAGNFESAKSNFSRFVDSRVCPNDPEGLIYLNNSIAELDSKSATRIAVSLPISRNEGRGALDALQVLRGVALAQSEINEDQGIQGKKLIVGIADDGFKKESNERKASEETARFLSQLEDIAGIIGHDSSDATESAAKIYNQSQIVAISPTSTAARKTEENPQGVDLGEYILRTALSDEVAAGKLAQEASKRYQKIAIVYDEDSDYSKSFKQAFEKIFVDGEQGEVVNSKDLDRCDTSKNAGYRRNPEDCLYQAKQGDAEALLLIPSSKNIDQIAPLIQLNFAGNLPLPLLGADSMYNQYFLRKEAENMILPITWHRSLEPSDFEDFAKDRFLYKDSNSQIEFKVDWTTATSYDAVYVLVEGLNRVANKCILNSFAFWDRKKQSTCTHEKLKNTLLEPNFSANGASGESSVEFTKDGDRRNTEDIGILVQVCPVANGKKFEFRRTEDCNT